MGEKIITRLTIESESIVVIQRQLRLPFLLDVIGHMWSRLLLVEKK